MKKIIIIGTILIFLVAAYFLYKKIAAEKLVKDKKEFQLASGLDAKQVEELYIKNGNKL